jgi:DNA-directed RNA polymerase
VVQRKPKVKDIQANTMLGEFCGNRRVMVQMRYNTEIPEPSKHGLSIAPNFIHSLDSCHLQNTINAMPDGVSFNMIHDSYGTHASDSRALYEAIRQQFYDIYKNKDVLQKFIEQQPEYELPELPEFGNLDLTEVLKSEYFFA